MDGQLIRYRAEDGVYHGWLLKTGRKWLHVRLICDHGTKRRLPLSEGRYITHMTPEAT